MWLSAAAIWQHTAHPSWSETNGKTNIRLISKEGEECAGEVRLQVLMAPPASPLVISSLLCVFMWAALRRQEHEQKVILCVKGVPPLSARPRCCRDRQDRAAGISRASWRVWWRSQRGVWHQHKEVFYQDSYSTSTHICPVSFPHPSTLHRAPHKFSLSFISQL